MLTSDELTSLRTLLVKEAVRDVLAVASRGIDRVAPDLLATAYHDESVDNHGAWSGNGKQFARLPGREGPENLSSHHLLGQSLIDVNGSTAVAETYFVMNYERFARKRDEVRVGTMIGRYLDRLDEVDGRWALTVRKVVIDSSVEASKADQPPGAASFPSGARWPDDEVFRIDDLRLGAATDGPAS